MNFKDWLTLYFERSSALQGLWGFYITVVLGLLAYFGTAKQSQLKIILAAIVSVGFVGFAYVNEGGLAEITQARIVARDAIVNYTDADPKQQTAIDQLKKTLDPSSLAGVRDFHVAADATVLVGLWILTLYKGKNHRIQNHN